MIFQSTPIFFDIVRLKCAKSFVLIISPLVSLMLDPLYYVSSLSKISGDKCRDHWSGTKLLGASRSASKSENSDRCNYSSPQLHWKQEYPRCCQIVFHRSETFPFNFVFLLESFSSKPHKTQPVFVALNLVGITSMACLPSIQLTFSQINKLI